MVRKKFPIEKPIVGKEEINAISRVIKSGRLSFFTGNEVRKFEYEFSEYVGSRYAIATSSGTAALHAALFAIDVGPGDNVIVPIITYVSTPMSVLYQNATPVFVDVSRNSPNIDTKKIEKAITENTKGIMPVHMCGIPCDMDGIMKIAKDNGLFIIEDSAQSLGSEYDEKKTGTLGDIGCFSFHESKNMTTGEGGMVVTDDRGLAKKIRACVHMGELTSDGMPLRRISDYKKGVNYSSIGWNYRMSEVQAAIGRVQLRKLNRFIMQRRKNAEYLINNLDAIEGIDTPLIPAKSKSAFNTLPVTVNSKIFGMSRDELYKKLSTTHVPVSKPYYRIYPETLLFKEMKGYGNTKCPFDCQRQGKVIYEDEFPFAKDLYKNSLVLRVDPNLGVKEMMEVVDAIRIAKGH